MLSVYIKFKSADSILESFKSCTVHFGIYIIITLDKHLFIFILYIYQGFQRPHDIAVSKDDKEIYVTQIGPNKVFKLSTSPDARESKMSKMSKREKSRP